MLWKSSKATAYSSPCQSNLCDQKPQCLFKVFFRQAWGHAGNALHGVLWQDETATEE
jgi:hypothetical protein